MKLHHRPFGNGPAVSLFTLGTMRALGSSEQMYSIVKAALSVGINHLETAPAYGPSEAFLGIAIKQLKDKGLEPPHGWVITSKLLPSSLLVNGKDQIVNSLKRLGIPKLDNLAIHGLNLPAHLEWAIHGEGSELLRWALGEGLIGQVGFSSHGSLTLINQAISSKHFQFCSLHLHLLNPERIPLAHKALMQGMGVMAISPADKGGQLHNPSKALIEDCSPIEPLELAYRFLISHEISTLTVGASRPEDLIIAEKMLDQTGPLEEREVTAIKQLRRNAQQRLGRTQCGQCRECLPCPQQVPIPELLHLRNLAVGHDLEAFTKERYNLIGRAGHWWEQVDGSACANCGDCLPRCPHKLPIPELLADTHKRLIDTPQRRLWS